MQWKDEFPKGTPPCLEQVNRYVATPLWGELCAYLEQAYGVLPQVEHSVCSGAPGWNIKYKKSGRALCTLYPAAGFFTCMVSVGSRETVEAEALLLECTDYLRSLYWNAKPFNGGRWLMIEVTSPEILKDVKRLIATRTKPSKPKQPKQPKQ